MKLLLGFFIIGLSTYLGKLFSNKYTKSKKFYEDFYSFNRNLLNNISFSNFSINQILKNYKNDSSFILFAKSYIFNEVNNNSLEFLTDNEKKFSINYLSEIGKSNRKSQIEFLNISDKEIRDKLNDSIENEKKYKPLYIKLGFLFGLIIFVIIL